MNVLCLLGLVQEGRALTHLRKAKLLALVVFDVDEAFVGDQMRSIHHNGSMDGQSRA